MAAADHVRNLLRRSHELVILLVEHGLVALHLVDERLLLRDFLLHDLARGARLLLLLGLRLAVCFEGALARLDLLLFVEHRAHEVVVLVDDALQKIHARHEVAEVLRAEQHVKIRNLTVHIDVPHAPAELVALFFVVFAEDVQSVLVFLHAAFCLVERGLARFVLRDGLVGLLVELALHFGKIIDLVLDLVALRFFLLRLLFVALLLVFEGGGVGLERSRN